MARPWSALAKARLSATTTRKQSAMIPMPLAGRKRHQGMLAPSQPAWLPEVSTPPGTEDQPRYPEREQKERTFLLLAIHTLSDIPLMLEKPD